MQTNKPRPEPEFLMPLGEDRSVFLVGPFKHLERPPIGWLEFERKCDEAKRDPWSAEARADWLRMHGKDE